MNGQRPACLTVQLQTCRKVQLLKRTKQELLTQGTATNTKYKVQRQYRHSFRHVAIEKSVTWLCSLYVDVYVLCLCTVMLDPQRLGSTETNIMSHNSQHTDFNCQIDI